VDIFFIVSTDGNPSWPSALDGMKFWASSMIVKKGGIVLLPADLWLNKFSNSIETIYAYKYLFSNTKNPKALSLTRQNLKFLDYDIDYSDFLNGGFVISKGEDLTIFASGSEVNLALEIKETLKEFSVQVVSVPILNKLTPEISKSLKNNKLTFTLELGKATGWSDYIGDVTESFSVQTFGKSAPEKDLAKFFKVNSESIGKKIKSHLG